MKKILFLIQLTLATLLYSTVSLADHGHHRHHRHHRHHGHHGYRNGGGYRQNFDNNGNYSNNYYQQPQDPRSHQGLAGGVVGSVLGYELANGNPLAAGLGAAAGSYLGNNMGR